MRDLAVLFLHLLATVARLAGPGGARSVVAESGGAGCRATPFGAGAVCAASLTRSWPDASRRSNRDPTDTAKSERLIMGWASANGRRYEQVPGEVGGDSEKRADSSVAHPQLLTLL